MARLHVLLALLAFSLLPLSCSSDDTSGTQTDTTPSDTSADTAAPDTETAPDTAAPDTETAPDTAGESDVEPDTSQPPDTQEPGWGKTARVNHAEIPAPDGLTGCYDLTGDGTADCGFCKIQEVLAIVGADYNARIQELMDEHSLDLLLEFPGVSDFMNTTSFTLHMYASDWTGTGDDYEVTASSFTDSGEVLVQIPGASITNGEFEAGPADFQFSFPLGDTTVELLVTQARTGGTVSLDEPGVAVADGVVSGVVTRQALGQALEGFQQYCAAQPEPKPSYCGYIDVVTPDLVCSALVDCDMQSGNATSVCLKFTGEGARIVGIGPTP